VEHDSTPLDLLNATPSMGAARITILAVRSGVKEGTALTPGMITLMPDQAVLSESRAVEMLAAMLAPVRYSVPEVRDGVLAVRCEQITESALLCLACFPHQSSLPSGSRTRPK
jgi:hypothetical protein